MCDIILWWAKYPTRFFLFAVFTIITFSTRNRDEILTDQTPYEICNFIQFSIRDVRWKKKHALKHIYKDDYISKKILVSFTKRYFLNVNDVISRGTTTNLECETSMQSLCPTECKELLGTAKSLRRCPRYDDRAIKMMMKVWTTQDWRSASSMNSESSETHVTT